MSSKYWQSCKSEPPIWCSGLQMVEKLFMSKTWHVQRMIDSPVKKMHQLKYCAERDRSRVVIIFHVISEYVEWEVQAACAVREREREAKNPVATFPIKKRINTELLTDRKHGLCIYKKWFKKLIWRGQTENGGIENTNGSLFVLNYLWGGKTNEWQPIQKDFELESKKHRNAEIVQIWAYILI